MRTFLVIILIAFFSQTGFGQQNQSSDEVFTIVEVRPEFEGGMQGFYNYITENLEYPEDAREQGVEGPVFVRFVIDKQGMIDPESVKVIRQIHPSLDNEAVRVIRESPKWTPGKITVDGPTASVRMILPISYKLNSNSKKKNKKNRI